MDLISVFPLFIYCGMCGRKDCWNIPQAGGKTHYLDCKCYFSLNKIYCTSNLHNREQIQPEAARCPSLSVWRILILGHTFPIPKTLWASLTVKASQLAAVNVLWVFSWLVKTPGSLLEQAISEQDHKGKTFSCWKCSEVRLGSLKCGWNDTACFLSGLGWGFTGLNNAF